MKKYLLLLVFYCAIIQSMETGFIILEAGTSPGFTQAKRINFAAQKKSYTAGGVIFTYPPGLFTAPPHVQVSVTLTGLGYSSIISVSTMILSNSATSTTVRVNKMTSVIKVGSSFLEAVDGDLDVEILALGS